MFLKIICVTFCFISRSSSLIFSSHFLISFISFLISLVLMSFGKIPAINFISSFYYIALYYLFYYIIFPYGFKAFKTWSCFISWSSIVSICFSNSLASGKYLNLACFLILLWSDANISSRVRYSCLLTLLYDNADSFAVSQLI